MPPRRSARAAAKAKAEAEEAKAKADNAMDVDSGDDDDEEEEEEEEEEGVFDDLVFTIQGRLPGGNPAAKRAVEDNGGRVVGTFSGKVTHVAVADLSAASGAKFDKAQAAGLPVVDEDWINKAVDDGKLPDVPKAAAKKGTKRKAAPAAAAPAKAKAAKKAAKAKAASPPPSPPPSPPAKKMKREVRKGRAVVEEGCPNAASVHVYEEGDDVWTATLNQTNIKNNNNKFYIIQLIESDGGKKYGVFTKWGRVGYPARTAFEPHGAVDSAKRGFCKKFSDKTKNRWDDREKFSPVPGKYTLIKRNYGDDDEDEEDGEEEEEEEDDGWTMPESVLPERVQDLVRLICDMDMMERQMVELGYDANKMPLGRLASSTIRDGYAALKDISEVISGETRGDLVELSNRFYTLIPHEFGMRPPVVINTPKLLKAKIEMVQELGEVRVAKELLKSMKGKRPAKNPVDLNYDKLKCDLTPLDKDGDEFKMVQDYVRNTHGKTHNWYDLEVEDVFDMDRAGGRDRFEKGAKDVKKLAKGDENRQLLWHGSRLTNYVGIISQGLRIAPPEAPVTGYMFGKGVYFADMVSKSANYCRTSPSESTGLMLLCDVSLGKMCEMENADYHADKTSKKAGCQSTKGIGTTRPDPKGTITLDDGTVVPMGEGMDDDTRHGLQYNEYIVYDTKQIRMRYLIRMKFNYKNRNRYW